MTDRWSPLEGVVAAGGAAAAGLAAHSVLNWRLLRKTPTSPTPQDHRPSVSVLIPARDEADRLGPTLEAVLSQEGVDLEVLVLDDGSTDDTTVVARGVADGDRRFRLLHGRAVPDGWLGKPFACWQLAEAAKGEVLVFLDADVTLRPGALAACVDMLHQGEMDLLSPYPRQTAHGVAERLVQPLLQWSWLTFLPLRLAEQSASPSMTAGNGQLIVARADCYRASGGHQQVRAEVIEDVELARAFKRAGLRVGMADGTDLATCRMYHGWAELREGYSKSLWKAFGSRRGAAIAVSLLALLYLVPPLGLLAGLVLRRRRLAVLGAAGYLAAVGGRAHTAGRTGSPMADAVAHPASIGMLIWLVRESWRRKALGALSWKGRPVT
ncbi:Glycosyl transferase, family 2 [Euzebya pacifica]|uniref:Glycosyl transferase, family 2 n=1 Tax=Euzebya pacifica TaxID=1608957 RepID=A0A346Y2K1_9ACTN|nr:glycosyltransferase family 2 protein [Euzebya pacifica]AXV08698.1 Glycosyl transferase, family 2 [Euzebya pacifica]